MLEKDSTIIITPLTRVDFFLLFHHFYDVSSLQQKTYMTLET